MNLNVILKVLANENRLQILQWLKDAKQHFVSVHGCIEKDGVCVGLIEKKSGLSQSTVSQYLMQLQQAGLITMERQGQWTFCKYNRASVQKFIKELERVL